MSGTTSSSDLAAAEEGWKKVLELARQTHLKRGVVVPPVVSPVQVPKPTVNRRPVVTQAAVKVPVVQVVTQPVSVGKTPTALVVQAETIQHQPKKGFVMVKDPWVRILFFVITGFLAMEALNVHRDWSADRRNNRELADALSEKKVAEIKVNTPVSEKKIRAVAVSAGPIYNCYSPESVEAEFFQKKIHALPSSGEMKVTGCLWLSVDKTVTFSGNDYRIEVPANESSSYACSSEGGQDCGKFLKHFPSGTAFRVMTMEGGHTTITQTN